MLSLRLSLLLAVMIAMPIALPSVASARGKSASASAKSKSKSRSKSNRRASKRAVERPVPWMRGNQPNVQALGAVVVDLDSGAEVYARRPDQPRAIASISKLAAALVAVDRGLEMEELTTISNVDADVARGGATSRLLVGMTLTNRDLLHAAMLGSDNRAVSALGRAVGLGSSQFAAAMTKRAAQMGLKQTRFREPTGLSPENVSTPRETILMLRAATEHPVLGPIVRKHEYDAHPVGRPPIRYVSTHKPAVRNNTQVLGGKTGYNDAARYCLVLAAKVDGRSYGMAFLGTEGKMTRFGDVARVADWLVVHKPALTPAATAVANGAPAPGTAGDKL